jgi:CubicO group peptidase (beta-lactamase class C family)
MQVPTNRSTGVVSAGFEPVRARFDQFLAEDDEFSAQIVALWRGRPVVDLAGGPHLDRYSLTGVFSVSKGVAGVVLATLVEDGTLDLDEAVVRYWPEFEAFGKGEVRVRELLSHQVGLLNLDDPLSGEEFVNSSLAASRLANGRPLWHPGSAFGYHGLTIGVFAEELVRRITGRTLQDVYETDIRAPRSIDFFLGLPESEERRYRPVIPMRPTDVQRQERESAPSETDGLMAVAFDALSGGGKAVGAVLPHTRAARAAGVASVGGVGSARGIAGVYSAALGYNGERLLSEDTIAAVAMEQVSGIDRVLNFQMAFATVFMKPQPRMPFGSYRAFGHDGAGGALGFADPMYDLAFGYIPMPMQYPGGADPKAVELSLLIRQCIRDRDTAFTR